MWVCPAEAERGYNLRFHFTSHTSVHHGLFRPWPWNVCVVCWSFCCLNGPKHSAEVLCSGPEGKRVMTCRKCVLDKLPLDMSYRALAMSSTVIINNIY